MKNAKSDVVLMTEGPIPSHVLRYALPLFVGNLFQQLYNTADALIVGNLVSSSALAAVTSTGTITFMAIGFFLGFSMGAGIVISRHVGAEDHEATRRAVHTTVAMGLLFSLVLTVAGFFLTPVVLRLMGTPEDVFPEANLYLRIYFGGSTGFVLYNTFVGILRASGDSRHPLYYLIFGSILNVTLDIFFIVVLGMGVDGAAIATVISQCVSAVLAFLRLYRREDSLRVRLREIRLDRRNFVTIVRFGVPTAAQNCMIDLANMMIQSYINSFSSAAVAGIGAYSKIEGFAFLPVTSFSMAMSTFISQNVGAGKPERIRRGARFGLLLSLVIVELIGVVIFLLAPDLIAAFNRDPEVVAYGVLRARICALFYCLLGFSHVSSAIMRGLGKPVTPMLVMVLCWCGTRVAVLTTIGQVYHDMRLACWLYPITWAMSSLTYTIYLRRLFRRRDGETIAELIS